MPAVVAATPKGPGSPLAVLATALAAARSEAAVDWTSHQHAGAYTATVVTEAGRRDGLQTITIGKGAQSGRVSAVLIGPKAYVHGDDFGLQANLGFTALAADVEAGRWLVVGSSSPSDQAAYGAVAGGMTVPSVVSQLINLTGSLSLTPARTVHGQPVVGVRATVPARAGVPAIQEVLYVHRGGRPLPVEMVVTGGGEPDTTVFGPWGQPPAAHPPAGAIPFDVAWLAGPRHGDLAIPGAPGYYTFTGPLGGPMQVGRPWGKSCQPVLFDVASDIPRSVYLQVAKVVGQARAAGLDVTIINLGNLWEPGLLYPPGQAFSTVKEVHIYAATGIPPLLAGGHPEHISIGWDARPAPDGRHEILTETQASLYMKEVVGQAFSTRRSMRQLIAFTQGISESVVSGSGLAEGTGTDGFRTRDIAAMQVMSGCHFEPTTGPVLPPQP
jgi:hypothetical protein